MKKTRFYTLFFLLLLPLNITTDSEYKEFLEDYDGDGLPDAYELAYDNDPYDRNDITKDSDGDGLTIQEEFIYGCYKAMNDFSKMFFEDGENFNYAYLGFISEINLSLLFNKNKNTKESHPSIHLYIFSSFE